MTAALLERAPAAARPALAWLLNLGLQLRRLFPEAALLCGRAAGGRLTVLALGREGELEAFTAALFSRRPHRLRLGRVFAYAPGAALRGLRAAPDLAVAATAPVWSSFWTGRGYFLLPKWADFSCATAHARPPFLRTRDKLNGDIRKLSRSGFACEVVRDERRVAAYYEEIYRPYIEGRFGALAETRGPESALALARRGGLLLVSRLGEPAAGVLFTEDRGAFRLKMAAPAPAHTRSGRCGGLAMTAMYYFALRLAGDLGYERVDFGGCRPFLNDGLFAYKRKWRMRLGRQTGLAPDFALKVLRLSPGARSFLAGSPFLFREGAALSGLVFLDAGPVTREQVLACRKKYWTEGLRRIRVASFAGFDGAAAPGPGGLELVRAARAEDLAAGAAAA